MAFFCCPLQGKLPRGMPTPDLAAVIPWLDIPQPWHGLLRPPRTSSAACHGASVLSVQHALCCCLLLLTVITVMNLLLGKRPLVKLLDGLPLACGTSRTAQFKAGPDCATSAINNFIHSSTLVEAIVPAFVHSSRQHSWCCGISTHASHLFSCVSAHQAQRSYSTTGTRSNTWQVTFRKLQHRSTCRSRPICCELDHDSRLTPYRSQSCTAHWAGIGRLGVCIIGAPQHRVWDHAAA
jgi:hypothetical protein